MTACATACDSLPLATGKNFLCCSFILHLGKLISEEQTPTQHSTDLLFFGLFLWTVFFFFNLLLSFCLYIFCTNCFLLLLPDGNGYSAQPEMSMINYTKVIKLSTKQVGTELLSTIYFRFYPNMKSFFRNCWLDRAGSAATPWCWAPLHGHGANWRKNSAYAIESCVSTYYQMCKW